MSALSAKITTVVNASFSQLREMIAYGDDRIWSTFQMKSGVVKVLHASVTPRVFNVAVNCTIRGDEVSVVFATNLFYFKDAEVSNEEIREEFQIIAEKYKGRFGITNVTVC